MFNFKNPLKKKMEINKIYNEDCIQGLKKIPNEYVDAVVTDPPYGIGFNYETKEINTNPEDYWKWLKPIYLECMRVLKKGGFIAIWQANKYFKHFWKWYGDDIRIYAGCKNFVQLRKTPINYGFDPIVIKYKNGANPLCPTNPKRSVDFFVANTAKFVTEVNSLAGKHPCPRPIDQTKELIDNFVIEKGLVLDPFIGSGTTAVACKLLKREYIGFELSPEYFKIATERIDKTGVFETKSLRDFPTENIIIAKSNKIPLRNFTPDSTSRSFANAKGI